MKRARRLYGDRLDSDTGQRYNANYKVILVVSELGWVDFDLGVHFIYLVALQDNSSASAELNDPDMGK